MRPRKRLMCLFQERNSENCLKELNEHHKHFSGRGWGSCYLSTIKGFPKGVSFVS